MSSLPSDRPPLAVVPRSAPTTESFAVVTLAPDGGDAATAAVVDARPTSPQHGRLAWLGPARDEVTGPGTPPTVSWAHNPRRAYGFAAGTASRSPHGVVLVCYRGREAGTGPEWRADPVITIPSEPATAAELPPLLRAQGVVPPLVAAVALSPDDRFLYVSCWGTGELRQYDVSDPFNPVLTGAARLGGLVWQAPHPGRPAEPLDGGPGAVAVSGDGRRVYVTSSIAAAWEPPLEPSAHAGWLARLDAGPDGGLSPDPRFLARFAPGLRPRAVRLVAGERWDTDALCPAAADA